MCRTSRSGLAGHAPRPSAARGFTLVEVLVAIVILSIGVLGAVGMQAAAMQSNKEARYQAIAGSMARELAEKMRGNHTVAIQTTSTANPYLIDATLPRTTTITLPSPNCFSTGCTTGLEVASWDIADWQSRIRDALPSPRVRICMDSDPFDSSGLPKWACDDTGNVAILKLSWNRADTQGQTEFTSANTTLPFLVLPLTAGSSQ
jgi:type IV pilus assembly protein PilV